MPYPLTVLYVEDEAETRELTRFFLEDYFTNVLCVADGEEALEVFFSTPKVDVVLTDLSLPGFDGFEMLRRMMKRREELEVIIFSAHTDTPLLLQAIELGVAAYLLKPFDPEGFEKAIGRAVARLFRKRESEAYREKLEEKVEKLEEECAARRVVER